MKFTLKLTFIIWMLLILSAIIFKIKMFVEIFPIVGFIFIILLLVYTIRQIVAEYKTSNKNKKTVDKNNKTN